MIYKYKKYYIIFKVSAFNILIKINKRFIVRYYNNKYLKSNLK